MNHHKITVPLSAYLLLFAGVCWGQVNPGSSQSVASSNAINNFNSAIGQQSWLYNGASYDPGRKIKNNPNFMDTVRTSNGTVTYYSFTYTDVPLLYDIYKDLLASVLFDGESWYSFTGDKVTGFILMGHHFIRLSPDSINKRIVKPGYYDDLYTNKLQVLVKRSKIIHIAGPYIGSDDYYEPKINYYLKKNDRYYLIKGQGDFISVLKDREKELNKYIKDNNIKFRKDPEQAMVALATYYDTLTN